VLRGRGVSFGVGRGVWRGFEGGRNLDGVEDAERMGGGSVKMDNW
jgi:hypothetical protein